MSRNMQTRIKPPIRVNFPVTAREMNLAARWAMLPEIRLGQTLSASTVYEILYTEPPRTAAREECAHLQSHDKWLPAKSTV